MKTIKGNRLNFKHALLSALVLGVMFLIFAVFCGIAPFGDRTFLMYDMKRQYVDFYAYLRTILSGENNVFYSFSTALGSGMLGFNIYYVSSPFLLFLNLFPNEYLPIGISILIGVKLMVAAFIMDLFLQYLLDGCGDVESADSTLGGDKTSAATAGDIANAATAIRHKFKISDTSVITTLGAVSWAFSSFLVAHSMNMMWIDVVMLLPVLIWALDGILLRNRKLPYIITLCLMLFLNYYITWQVLIFTALWTLKRLFDLKDKHPIRQIWRVLISTVLPALIMGAVLVPTALELMNSPKDITQLGLETAGKYLSYTDILSKIPTLSYDYIEARFGGPQIFCGVLFTILGFLFFLNKKIELRRKISYFVMFNIFLISFSKDIINLIWHAGMEPSGHPYRQAFMWIFMMVLIGTESLMKLKENHWIMGLVASIMLAVMYSFCLRLRYDHITELAVAVNITLLVAYAVVVTLYLVLVHSKRSDTRVGLLFILLLAFIQITDITANAGYTFKWQSQLCDTQSEYSDVVSKTKEAVEYVNDTDVTFFRMENLNPRQQNDSMQYAYNGVTHYSSAGMTYVRYFLQRLGFNDDELYTHYGHDNTATADAILGVKYILSDETYPAHNGYTLVYDGDEKVYENPNALSVAVGTSDFDLSGISMNIDEVSSDNWFEALPSDDPFSLQVDILRRLAGADELNSADADSEAEGDSDGVLSASAAEGSSDLDISENESVDDVFVDAEYTYSDSTDADGNVTRSFTIEPVMDGEVYMYLNGLIGEEAQGLTVFLEDEVLSSYGNSACIKILNLGYHKAGEIINVKVTGNSDPNFGEEIFVTENMTALSEICNAIKENNATVTKESSSHLLIEVASENVTMVGNTDDTKNINGIFLTIPCESGWTIKVNGKEVTPVSVYGSLTYIPLEESVDANSSDTGSGENTESIVSGENSSYTIEMTFVPDGFIPGIELSLVGIALAFLYIFFTERKKHNKVKQSDEGPDSNMNETVPEDKSGVHA